MATRNKDKYLTWTCIRRVESQATSTFAFDPNEQTRRANQLQAQIDDLANQKAVIDAGGVYPVWPPAPSVTATRQPASTWLAPENKTIRSAPAVVAPTGRRRISPAR